MRVASRPTLSPVASILVEFRLMALCGINAVLDQFDLDHLGAVALAGDELGGAGIAARAVLVAGSEVLHDLLGDVLAIEERGELAAALERAALAGGDHLLDDRADGAGLGPGRLDLLIENEAGGEVPKQGLPGAFLPVEYRSFIAVAHTWGVTCLVLWILRLRAG